ncbi:MAG: flagellar export protein FliJ [Marinagarivorans sp.]|nr:flagellar export protein FliJ [Marinagarivorans sp.]
MVTTTKRMDLILDLAEKEVEAAASKFTDAKNKLVSEKNKLDDILAYLNDYTNSSEKAGTRLMPEQMIRQRAFVQQLSQAQSQQRILIAQTERDMEHKKSLWQKTHLKQRAMQDLVKRLSTEDQARLDKVEEKLLDEFAQQQYVRSEAAQKLH